MNAYPIVYASKIRPLPPPLPNHFFARHFPQHVAMIPTFLPGNSFQNWSFRATPWHCTLLWRSPGEVKHDARETRDNP